MIGVVAHEFKHVDRVRQWALRIAAEEGFENMEMVETAALLHDIGLPYIDEEKERGKHGQVGAEIAEGFLKENSSFTEEQIEKIVLAVRYHSSPPTLVTEFLKGIGEKGRLLEIIRDADMLDAVGAVGLMRAFTSKSGRPEYNQGKVKGDTWGLSSEGFDDRFADGLGVGETIVDHINFQISLYDNLHTKTARRLAQPLLEFMKEFIIQLEREANAQ